VRHVQAPRRDTPGIALVLPQDSIGPQGKSRQRNWARTVPLCVECSICCNGSIFSRVPMTAEDKACLTDGQFFTKADGSLRMRLGCNFPEEDGSCAVYDKRTKTCATYACRLLGQLNQGKIDDRSARDITASFKSYVKKAKEACARSAGEDRAKGTCRKRCGCCLRPTAHLGR